MAFTQLLAPALVPAQDSFNLLKSFALWSFIVITTLSVISAVLMSNYIRNHLLNRDATVSMEFVQSLSDVTDTTEYFTGSLKVTPKLQTLFEQISRLPDVLRVNMYSTTGSVIWSSERSIQFTQLVDNHELDQALNGELVVEIFRVDEPEKVEHKTLDSQSDTFLEYYLPIRSQDRRRIIGVAELYKQPVALITALQKGYWLIWTIAILSGLLLYTTLFWLLRRGNSVIELQQVALVEAERMATIGNMVASVAHSIRNPIASMRSSAELGMDVSSGEVREYFHDIINEVDRFDDWVRELLIFSRKQSTGDSTIDEVNELINQSIQSFGDRPERLGVSIVLDLKDGLPRVRGDAELIGKVVNSLISNALEAMPEGGVLRISTAQVKIGIYICVTDNGVGMSETQRHASFTPMVSTKPDGLGIGLVLAKRVIESYGGTISLQSEYQKGTQVQIHLLEASA